jgi:hypothetical protein
MARIFSSQQVTQQIEQSVMRQAGGPLSPEVMQGISLQAKAMVDAQARAWQQQPLSQVGRMIPGVGAMMGAAGAVTGGPAGQAMGQATQAMNAMTNAARVMGSHLMTTTEKVNALVSQIPVVGSFVNAARTLGDVLSGTERRMQRLMVAHELWLKVLETEGQYVGRLASATLAAKQAGFEATALGGLTPSAYSTARTTYGESIAYQEERRRAYARDAIGRAEAQATAARRTAGLVGHVPSDILERERASQQRLQGLREAYRLSVAAANSWGGIGAMLRNVEPVNRAIAEASKAQGTPFEKPVIPGTREADQQLLLAAEREVNNQKAIAAEREQAMNQAKERGLAVVQAESAVRKANIQMAKTELEIAQQRESRAAGQAQTLGGMNRMQREVAFRAAQQVATRGWENVSPEVQGQVRALDPALAARFAQQSGEGVRARFRGLGGQFAEAFGDDLGATRERVDVAEREVRKLEFLDAAKTARAMEVVLNKFAEDISEAMARAVNNARMQFNIQQQRKNRGV